jgi:hypothetical protein
VAAQSKAWSVPARSYTGIVGSNPTRSLDSCMSLFCVVLCVGSGFATGWSPRPRSPTDVGGNRRIDPRFLNLGTSWRWVVSFMLRLLYPRRKGLRYPLDRRLGGPQSRSGQRGEVKILDPTGTRIPTPRSSRPQPVAMLTALSRLLRKARRLLHFSILFKNS